MCNQRVRGAADDYRLAGLLRGRPTSQLPRPALSALTDSSSREQQQQGSSRLPAAAAAAAAAAGQQQMRALQSARRSLCHHRQLLRRQLAAPMAAAASSSSSSLGQQQDGPPPIVDPADWQHLQRCLQTYDEQREIVIKRTRDAQKSAKQAIYSLHRGDHARAAQQLQGAEQVAEELLPIIQQEPLLRQGSFAAAMEEYAEAQLLRVYLQEGRLLRAAELSRLCSHEEYLGGLLDFAGELNRHAVMCATRRDVAAVLRARDVVDALMGAFLQLDLRNGALRKKYDSLKYTQKRLETMLYELSLAEAMGGLVKQRVEEPELADVPDEHRDGLE